MESDTQRLGNRRGVDTSQIRLAVQGVGGGIPELDVVAEPALLLLSQIRDRHLDLNTRGFSHNSFHHLDHAVICGGDRRLGSAQFRISALTPKRLASSFGGFG